MTLSFSAVFRVLKILPPGILLVVLAIYSLPAAVLAAESRDSTVEAARQELIQELSRRFPKEEVGAIFSDPRLALDESVIPPKKHRAPVQYYRSILTPASVREGRQYVERHAGALSRAQRQYGVAGEVIAAILRVETNFGRNVGRRRILNSLYSLYVLVPGRKNFALRELQAFLSICRQKNWDPYETVGSPMGAFGIPQFLPSSYVLYAKDADRDGTADVFSTVDAIHSTASYLHEFGWANSRKSQFQAIYAYNHEREYVKAVLAYAERLRTPELPEPLRSGRVQNDAEEKPPPLFPR